MAQMMMEETQLKELFKQAMVEVLQERKDLLYELVEDILEDMALLRAIKEGESTDTMSKADVLRVLEALP